jgi:hypothetical protein
VYAHAHENRLFTEKCKYSAEKKLTKRDEGTKGRRGERKKATSNTQQAIGRHAKKGEKKRAASNTQQATSRHVMKNKASACDVWA